MHIVTAHVRGSSPLVFGRYHGTPKLNKELADAYERRTWREKLHINEEGVVVIPAMAWKNCISGAAKYLSVQIPGKGKSTYTKNFESGVLVFDDTDIGVKKDEVNCIEMFVPADGVRGSGKRVLKFFPQIPKGWETVVTFHIFDDLITEDVFLHHLKQAGLLIGIGSFRVRNNGTCGRFRVESLEWREVDESDIA